MKMTGKNWGIMVGCAILLTGCAQTSQAEPEQQAVMLEQSSDVALAAETEEAVVKEEIETEEIEDTSAEAVDTETANTAGVDAETTNTEAVSTEEKAVESTETKVLEVQEQAGMTVDELYAKIQQSVSLVSPMEMTDDFITNYYGMDTGIFEEYVFSMSESATSAETIVIMKLKNTADTATVQAALQTIVEEKKAEMENYLPEQYDIVNQGTIESKGQYVWLVISASRDSITKMIADAIS